MTVVTARRAKLSVTMALVLIGCSAALMSIQKAPFGGFAMDERDSKSQKQGSPGPEPRRAKITTKTAKQMMRLLEGQELELVGRGPRRMEDGTFVAHVIATEEVLEKLPKDIGQIEIAPKREIPKAEARVGTGNRYREEGSVPHGVGEKK
jgi:hypothetical protein